MYYTNELVPELPTELKKLTSRCKKLFGKFPVSIPTVNDPKKFGVWFNRPFYDMEKDKPWRKIENTFYDCIWEGSRGEAGRNWFKFLRENDKDLNKILEFEEDERKVAFQYIESLTEEKLDVFREKFAPYYTKPKESLTIQDLQHSFWHFVEDRYRETNENYVKMMKSKDSKLEPLIEFQKDFDSLLTKFCLKKVWVAESVFRAIRNGTGKLQMETTFREDTSQEIFHEIHDRLKPKTNTEIEDPMMEDFNYVRYATQADGDYIHESIGQCFPDPLGRQLDEYISPNRRPPSYYEKVKKNKRVWLSMFQGRPSSEEGDFFDVGKISIIDESLASQRRTECVAFCRAWDNAASEDGGAYSVGVLMGIRPDGRITVFDIVRAQLNSADRLELQRATAEKDGADVPVRIPQDPLRDIPQRIGSEKLQTAAQSCDLGGL